MGRRRRQPKKVGSGHVLYAVQKGSETAVEVPETCFVQEKFIFHSKADS